MCVCVCVSRAGGKLTDLLFEFSIRISLAVYTIFRVSVSVSIRVHIRVYTNQVDTSVLELSRLCKDHA